MGKDKMLEEFYNYTYWREEQRKQLTISSNVYFWFSTAIVGYTTNLLISDGISFVQEKTVSIILIIGIFLSLISLVFYILFVDNKLKDYQCTAKLIRNKSICKKEISNLTKDIGKKTWVYYKTQKWFLIIGGLISFLGFSIKIFSL